MNIQFPMLITHSYWFFSTSMYSTVICSLHQFKLNCCSVSLSVFYTDYTNGWAYGMASEWSYINTRTRIWITGVNFSDIFYQRKGHFKLSRKFKSFEFKIIKLAGRLSYPRSSSWGANVLWKRFVSGSLPEWYEQSEREAL